MDSRLSQFDSGLALLASGDFPVFCSEIYAREAPGRSANTAMHLTRPHQFSEARQVSQNHQLSAVRWWPAFEGSGTYVVGRWIRALHGSSLLAAMAM